MESTTPIITTDLAGLKRLGKEFLDALPSATEEEAQAGWNCFALAYLGTKFNSASDEVQGRALFNIISRKMLEVTAKGYSHARSSDQ